MVDLENYNVYLEVYSWSSVVKQAPTPHSIVKTILNYIKKRFY